MDSKRAAAARRMVEAINRPTLAPFQPSRRYLFSLTPQEVKALESLLELTTLQMEMSNESRRRLDPNQEPEPEPARLASLETYRNLLNRFRFGVGRLDV